jgi:hypothetical protein
MRRPTLALRVLLLSLAAVTCSSPAGPDKPLPDRPNFSANVSIRAHRKTLGNGGIGGDLPPWHHLAV